MSIKRWKFHETNEDGYWISADRIEADYPEHPMAESYVLHSDHTAAVEAAFREGARLGVIAGIVEADGLLSEWKAERVPHIVALLHRPQGGESSHVSL